MGERVARATLDELTESLQGLLEVEDGERPALEIRPDVVLAAGRFLRNVQLRPGSVVLVPNPLRTRLLERVLGWADRRRSAAVVSAHGLEPSDPDTPRRLAKLAAHEVGHLRGLRHCRERACLARPVSQIGELDPLQGFCQRCRRLLLPRG